MGVVVSMTMGSGSSTVPSGATRAPYTFTTRLPKASPTACPLQTTSQCDPFQATLGKVWLKGAWLTTMGVVSTTLPAASRRAA